MNLQRSSLERAIAGFGLDTITLAGPLEAKLEAMAEAGFSQVMLKANDLVGHPAGWRAGVCHRWFGRQNRAHCGTRRGGGH